MEIESNTEKIVIQTLYLVYYLLAEISIHLYDIKNLLNIIFQKFNKFLNNKLKIHSFHCIR